MKPKRLLLLGNPNAGKTLLFNRLTGLSARVGNYPGFTVEVHEGHCNLPDGRRVSIIDLPGTYSLHPRSEDEGIAAAAALGKLAGTEPSDPLIVVVDATQLKRNLYLVSQLLELKRPMVIALTMMDLAQKQHIRIDVTEFSKRLGAPVIPLASTTGKGLNDLLLAMSEQPLGTSTSAPNLDALTPSQISQRYAQIDQWMDGIYQKPDVVHSYTPKLDAFLLHRIWGPLALIGIFGLMFQVLFTGSKPLVHIVELLVSFMSDQVKSIFGPNSLAGSLIADGIISGVGSVLAFVPLIALLFFMIGILEDTGYLSRATFLLDKMMSKVGLPGRAFVPLLSGFACAVPAILATRVLDSKRDRLITILVTPLTSCSARLPLYGLLTAACFSSSPLIFGIIHPGAILLPSMYILGIVAAFGAAAFLRYFVIKGTPSTLILELPPYRAPRWKALVHGVWGRVRLFVKEAGTIILAITLVLWALFSFPRHVPIEHTVAGQIGHAIEPVIAPLGLDWKIGVGLLASFAAREVMVSTLAVIYGISEADETSQSLEQALAQNLTPLAALSLMVFFALAMQCMSTLATTKKETQSWRWPIFQFSYMTALAWLAAFAVFQIGSKIQNI